MARFTEFSSIDLVRLCAASNDVDAWTEFIRRFQHVIGAAAYRTARQWGEPSRSQLDDLVQETYLKLCENDSLLLRSFQPRHEDSIYGFLKVVAANVVHDHYKSVLAAKRGAGHTETIDDGIHIAPKDPAKDSFEIVSRRIQLDKIESILQTVAAGKDRERKCAIFWLHHRQGLTASEIATIPSLRLTTEGVESLLLRLSIVIRSHIAKTTNYHAVKVLPRRTRSKRSGS